MQGGYHTQQLLLQWPRTCGLTYGTFSSYLTRIKMARWTTVPRVESSHSGVMTRSQKIRGGLLKKLKDLKADHGLLAYDDFVVMRSPPFCLRKKYCHLSLHSDREDFNVCLQQESSDDIRRYLPYWAQHVLGHHKPYPTNTAHRSTKVLEILQNAWLQLESRTKALGHIRRCHESRGVLYCFPSLKRADRMTRGHSASRYQDGGRTRGRSRAGGQPEISHRAPSDKLTTRRLRGLQ